MGFIFNKNKLIKIYIAKEQPECVKLAVEDLISDIEKICCKTTKIDSAETADIVVCMKGTPEFNKLAGNINLSHDEEYMYLIKNGKISFFGADDLGTMWAIYSFIENELKIILGPNSKQLKKYISELK